MDETPGEMNNQPDSKSEQNQQVGAPSLDSTTTRPVPTMEPSAEKLSSGNESTQVPSQLGTSSSGVTQIGMESTESTSQGSLLTSKIESSLVQEAAEKITSSLPIQRTSEGLSSLVSYSSSSAEASGSEDNAQDDQEESSLPSLPDAQKEEQKEEQKVENEPEVVKKPEVEKVLEKEGEPMEVSIPEIQETAPAPSAVPESQQVMNTAPKEEETLETLDMTEDPETLLEKVFGLVEKEEMAREQPLQKQSQELPLPKESQELPIPKESHKELPIPKESPELPVPKESQELPIPKESPELPIPKESQELPVPKESQELPIPKESQELPIPKESQELPIPKESQELPIPKESQELPIPKESQELPIPKKAQELPIPKESQELPIPKASQDPLIPKEAQEPSLPKESKALSLPKESQELPLPKEPQELSLPKEPEELPLPKEQQALPLPKEPQEVPLPKEPQELPLPQESKELPLPPETEELPVQDEPMEVEESTTPVTDIVQEEPKAVATDPEVRQPTPDTPQDEGPEEVPDDSTFENEEKSDAMEDQEELPSVESVHKADPLPESIKSPVEEDGETCTLKLSSDESTGPTEVDYKANAEEEKKQQLLESVESSRSEPDTQETVKEGTAFDVENTLGMKLKRVLDEEKENSSEEPVMKRACMEEIPVSSTSFQGKLLERQNTIPFEPELEEGLSEQMMTSEEMKAESIQKSDEESRDDGLSLSSDLKDTSKLDDLKNKVKEEEEEMATPTSRRRRKKKSYERPRGEGGKFRKEKPDASVMDEDTRMDSSLLQDEDSQGSISKREVRRFRCEVIVPESTEAFTADKVVEYVWPLEGIGEHYFIQEQISQYLGIMSFKRKYPDLRRRPIDMQERDYLKEKGLVSEMACDLGLTAVRSEDVLDVMFNDFPSKFEELQRLLRERKEIEMKERGKISYSMANIDKSKMQEYGRKAAEDAARWNAAFNKEKRDERRYSFDLQTFTLQMPVGRGKKLPPEMTKMGYYTVAVLPGQFTDYYREYSSAALSSMPLNSVVAPPVTRDTLGSDGAASDSEEEATVPVPDETDGVETKDEKGEDLPQCKVCGGNKNRNKSGKPEPLIICGSCRSASHPTCIDLTLAMVPKIESYNWQCMDCKNCVLCSDPDDEEKMIFCDMCDRGYHIYCVGLRRVPNGRWHCKECAICSSCGSKTPAGNEHVKNAEWQHEFKKDKDNKQLKYATTLCVPCDKYWKRRQFCYVCLKVYRSIPEDGMVRCSNCPKYIHKEGCSTMYENERFCNNCFKMRNTTALNHSRIIAAAKKKMASGY